MTEAVRGTYSDFKVIKGRKVVQFIIEIPVEDAQEAIDLFGMPQFGAEQWVAIAPLKSGSSEQQSNSPAKKTYQDKSPGGQAVSRAAILCTEKPFQDWISDRDILFSVPGSSAIGKSIEEFTATLLREELKIESRSEIGTHEDVHRRFVELEGKYRDFLRFGDGP